MSEQPIPGEDGQTVPATEKPYKTDGATVTNRRSGQIRSPATGNPYRMKPGTHNSRNSQLDRIKGLEVAHLYKSRKHAEEICTAWNETFRNNGEL